MAYFADLTAYSYVANPLDRRPALNVGWLAAGYAFPQGEVAAAVVATLTRICVDEAMHRMRGYHPCDFCDQQGQPRDPTLVSLRGRSVTLGDAEIRVQGIDGTLFAAPNLICHYVAVHAYAPPPAFIEAIVRQG